VNVCYSQVPLTGDFTTEFSSKFSNFSRAVFHPQNKTNTFIFCIKKEAYFFNCEILIIIYL